MIRSKEIALNLHSITIKAKQWGNSEGIKVLALHGWMDNLASFDPLAPLLKNLNLVAVDLPGHGQSDHVPEGSGLHFIDLVPNVLDIADRLGWRQFVLLGHSMGAAVATLVAGCVPERIQKMILLEGLGPLSQTAEETPDRLLKSIQQEAKIRQRSRRLFPSIQNAISARMAGSDLDRNSAEILVKRALVKQGEHCVFTHDQRLRSASRIRLTEEMVLAFFQRILCPTLFIEAEDGWPFPEDLVQKRLSSIKDLHHEVIAGGHHVHMTHPHKIAEYVNAFLSPVNN